MKRVLDIVIPIVLTGLIAWAGWLTTSVFSGEKNQAVANKEVSVLCDKLEEFKKDMKEQVKEIKTEIKEQEKARQADRDLMLNVLRDIRKEVKK